MEPKRIGKFIASIRKEKKLTQKELADKLYITDKAISKWERGLSIPDIEILEKLSKLFDVEIEEIIYGERTNKTKKMIEDAIEKEREKIKKINQKNKKINIIILIFILIVLSIILFKNISFGYKIVNLPYNHTYYKSNINLGIPKTSFDIKNNDRSYSFKNFRNSTVLKTEINSYLKTLKYSTCNNTIYYYNEKDNYSIIEYDVKDNFLYSIISYEVVERDYCYDKKIKEAKEKLGLLKIFRVYPNNIDYKNPPKEYVEIKMTDGGNNGESYEFVINLEVTYIKGDKKTTLEKSYGTYEIKNNKLYYYRTKIDKETKISIPEVSVFEIKDKKLHLTENYLNEYTKEVVL